MLGLASLSADVGPAVSCSWTAGSSDTLERTEALDRAGEGALTEGGSSSRPSTTSLPHVVALRKRCWLQRHPWVSL